MLLRHTEVKKRGRTLRGRLRSEKKKLCLKGSLKRGAEGGEERRRQIQNPWIYPREKNGGGRLAFHTDGARANEPLRHRRHHH